VALSLAVHRSLFAAAFQVSSPHVSSSLAGFGVCALIHMHADFNFEKFFKELEMLEMITKRRAWF
jgi:hypothetical protein